jgi:hypothetical protein
MDALMRHAEDLGNLRHADQMMRHDENDTKTLVSGQ